MLALNGGSIWSKNGVWIEDGYITFDFYIQRGYNDNVKHFLNLVQTNSADPYELEFRHNAYGNIDSSSDLRPAWCLSSWISCRVRKQDGEVEDQI